MDSSFSLAVYASLTLSLVSCASVSRNVDREATAALGPAWVGAACEYASALRDHLEKRAPFDETLSQVMTAQASLEEVQEPDVDTMIRLLGSQSEGDRECALAAADVREFVPDAVALKIIGNFRGEGTFARYLSGLALGHMTAAQVQRHSKSLAAALLVQPTSLSINANRGVLLRMDGAVALDLFVSLMEYEDLELRISVCDIAFRRPDDLGRGLAAELQRRGMTDALAIAAMVESKDRNPEPMKESPRADPE